MEIKDFIKIEDKTLPPKVLASCIKYLNKVQFHAAGVVGTFENPSVVDKKTRDVDTWCFGNVKTMSDIHWTSLFIAMIKKIALKYDKDLNLRNGACVQKILNVDALRYKVGGHYIPHVDHGALTPRTLSVIYFLNNDYEGGKLNFVDPQDHKKIVHTVDPEPGRLIMWPSNFIYPHGVTPVTKGERFVIVSWLL